MSEPQRADEPLEVLRCGCGATYTSPVVMLSGRSWPVQRRCDRCTDEAKRKADASAAGLEAERRARAGHLVGRAEAAAAREREAAIESARAALAVPPLYVAAALETFELHGTPAEQASLRAVRGYAADFVEQFPRVPLVSVFAGAPGSGKGHISWAIAKQLVERGQTARFVKLADLVRELRASWAEGGSGEGPALERFRYTGLLVLDEVSRHAFYGQPVQHLYAVLDHRIEQLRPTILTSNESEAGLAEILSPALWDRVQGHGGIVDFGTASWRRRRGTAAPGSIEGSAK